MKACPCKGCGERVVEPNCHDACPVSARGEFGYDEWKAELAAKKADLNRDVGVMEYNRHKTDRMWSRLGWKRDGQR